MDLNKNATLLADLRKAKGMTQREIAEEIGVLPKTVSKWETGNGFPDVSLLPKLAELYGVSTDTLLSGQLPQNTAIAGNLNRTQFFVCPHCGSLMQGIGSQQIFCCGKQLSSMPMQESDDAHTLIISVSDDDIYITMQHEMTKTHYISFVAYVTCDRMLLVKLYPEQDCAVRIPRMRGGRLLYCCNQHGLFWQRH